MGEVSIVAIAIAVLAGFYVGLSNSAVNRKIQITLVVLVAAVIYGLVMGLEVKTAIMTFGMLYVAGYAVPSFLKSLKNGFISKFGQKKE